jgi:predicted RND superfamily exporter protein
MKLAALNWPARHPLAALGIAAVIAILSAITASRLKPDPSLQSLFPRNDPAAGSLLHVLENYPSAGEFLILATTPGDQPSPERLLAFADTLKHQIERDKTTSTLVSAINYRTDAESRDFVANVVVPNGIFYLSDSEFEAARHRLTRSEMVEQLRQDEAMLAVPGPMAGAIAKSLVNDPLRLREFIAKRFASFAPFRTYQNSDAFLSPDGRSLLIRIAGTRPPSDLAFCRKITSTLSALAQQVNVDQLSLEFSGAYPIAAQSERSIRKDSIFGVIGSVACLAALFVVAFRRPLPLFSVTFAPVAMGVLYGFGIYALTTHSISPFTGIIGAMLAGIGIDYAIFYVVHYQQRRSNGRASVDTAGDTVSTIGGALLGAWVTSVVGFVAIGFASIPALRDFSVLGSLGLAGALLGTVIILPALLVLSDRGKGKAESPRGLRISIRPLLAWIDRHAKLCITCSTSILLAAIVGLAWAGPWLGLETDPTVMHPRPNPPLDAEVHIAERMGSAPDSLIIHLRVDSPEKLLALAHRVDERLASPAAKTVGVAATFSLATLLPDPAVVSKRLDRVGAAYAQRVTADFDSAVAQSSFNAKSLESYRRFLTILLTPASAPGVHELVPYTQLSKTFLPRQPGSGAAPTEAITLVFLRQTLDQRDARQSCIANVRSLLKDLPGATPTGMGVLSLDTEATIRRDLPRLIFAAISICAVYLMLHFRSVPYAVLAMLPTFFSLVSLLVIAKLAGARMNVANMISIPLLIGVDVDYGIFLVSVIRSSTNRADLLQRATASSQAVILCAASTLLGFGSLAFTSVPAVRSLGIAVAIGVVTCAAATLFLLLPLLLWMRERSSRGIAAVTKVAASAGALVMFCGLQGCSAPSGRLSFPAAPLTKAQNVEWFDVGHTGRPQFGVTTDDAGRVDRLLYDDTGSGHIDREYRLSDYANERVPHLILLLDSIPFETMRERYDAGDFRWFDPPQKMIAPFPSLTEICYGDILHAPPLPGVSDQYFDPRDEETKGILWDRVNGFVQPWERRLAYHANYMQDGLSFLDPEPWYAAELELARKALEQSPDRVTVVYIASAASMVCKYGKAGAEKVLDGARQLCLQLLYERRGAIKISMMADHGHNYMPSKNILLNEYLKEAGFHPAEKLRKPRDCVVEINALVTCAGIHTREPAEVASVVCRHEPVELAMYMDGARVIVRNGKGTSAVECRGGLLRYLPLDADVLGYGPLIAQLKVSGEMDQDGYASEEVWFRRTLDHQWPNAPRRMWDALHGRFITTPTVLLSIKDGYYAGSPSYEKYIKMASTHGGLNQVNSATFVMTMTRRLKQATRHEDVIATVEPGFEPRVQK